jgi:hypothetical protein
VAVFCSVSALGVSEPKAGDRDKPNALGDTAVAPLSLKTWIVHVIDRPSSTCPAPFVDTHVRFDFVVGVPGVTASVCTEPVWPCTDRDSVGEIVAGVAGATYVNVIAAPSLLLMSEPTLPADGVTAKALTRARVMPAAFAGVIVHVVDCMVKIELGEQDKVV